MRESVDKTPEIISDYKAEVEGCIRLKGWVLISTSFDRIWKRGVANAMK